ncbi:unnamed protein product [Arctia plantaginis]|uniref:Carboxylesterase type B domain-containing protein n=1 Tax=Arctia plantaginis TaxID=874455 RepID=A0A8S1A1S4_ARCPL|nr:unnamed protein product [Arctia plantaginis]
MWDPKSKIIILILPFLIHNGGAFTRIDPLVETKLGLIRGLRASDGDYSMFMGIPYATVNESNPFGPSKPHPGFDETFEAYDDSSVCPQVEEFVSPWGLLGYEPDTSAPLKLAENLGLPTSDTDEALEFLARTDLKLVLASAIELNLQLRPCVEQHFDDVETFIYDYPINIQNSNLGRMPILIGHTSDEMSGFFERTTSEEYAVLNVFYDTLKDAFNFENDDLVEMETYIRHFYIGDEAFSAEVEQDLTIFASDFNFNYPAVRTINKYVNNGATNVYYYVFSYDGDRPFFKILNNITSPGAGHADEIGYLFDVSFMDQKPSDEDQLIIDRITSLWTNFAKYGQPVPQVTELLPVQWPAVTKQTQYYLNIDSELEVKKRIFKQRMTMWNLFYKINEKFQIGYRDTDE